MKQPQIKIEGHWHYIRGIDWYEDGNICFVSLDYNGEFMTLFHESGSPFRFKDYEGSELHYMDLETAEWDQ